MRFIYTKPHSYECTGVRISEMKIDYGPLIKNTLPSNLAASTSWIGDYQQFNVFIHFGLRDEAMIKIWWSFLRQYESECTKFSGGVETNIA